MSKVDNSIYAFLEYNKKFNFLIEEIEFGVIPDEQEVEELLFNLEKTN